MILFIFVPQAGTRGAAPRDERGEEEDSQELERV